MNDESNTNVERRSGVDRRLNPPALVPIPTSRIHILLSAITTIAAIAALIVALVAFSDRLDSIQTSRVQAATDTCNLISRISLVVGAQQGRLPETKAFLRSSGLANCIVYGKQITLTK